MQDINIMSAFQNSGLIKIERFSVRLKMLKRIKQMGNNNNDLLMNNERHSIIIIIITIKTMLSKANEETNEPTNK